MTDTFPAPLDDAELAATWSAAWSSLSVQASGGLQSELMAARAEPHRHYHDQRHLRQCLALWARWRGHCEQPGEVAIALWFVDAIYDLRDGSNELNCAAWAARSLTRAGAGAGADSDTAQRLVMATRSTKLRRRWGRVPTHGRSSTSRNQDARAQVLQNVLDRTPLYTVRPCVHARHVVTLLLKLRRLL
jgi:hypothetical protein